MITKTDYNMVIFRKIISVYKYYYNTVVSLYYIDDIRKIL
jgi:hypothetical protein